MMLCFIYLLIYLSINLLTTYPYPWACIMHQALFYAL